VSIELEKELCTAAALAGMRAPAAAAGERERDDGRDSGCQNAAYRGLAPCTSTAC
jgi:hypothetical protein